MHFFQFNRKTGDIEILSKRPLPEAIDSAITGILVTRDESKGGRHFLLTAGPRGQRRRSMPITAESAGIIRRIQSLARTQARPPPLLLSMADDRPPPDEWYRRALREAVAQTPWTGQYSITHRHLRYAFVMQAHASGMSVPGIHMLLGLQAPGPNRKGPVRSTSGLNDEFFRTFARAS